MTFFSVNPEYSFDLRTLDLGFFWKYDIGQDLRKDFNFNLFDLVYPDVYNIQASQDGSTQELVLAGSSFVAGVNFLASGTVNLVMVYDHDVGTYQWFAIDIEFSAGSLYDAIVSPSRSDDDQFIESVFSNDDFIILSELSDYMHGLSGDDSIFGYGGADSLFGDDGDDLIYGGTGNDVIDGGAGNDIIVYETVLSDATITRHGIGNVTVASGLEGVDTVLHAEFLQFDDGFYHLNRFLAVAEPLISNFGAGAGAGGWSGQDVYPRHVGDVNGDGYTDVVGFGFGGVLVSFGSVEGSFTEAGLVVSNFGQTAGWTSDNVFHRELADVNGDGRSDIVGFGVAGTLVSLARADGGFDAPLLAAANFGRDQGWSNQDGFARTMGDVNGDGFADIVGFGAAGTLVALGQGDGTFGTAALTVSNFGVAQGWTSDTAFHRTVADVDGDGHGDLVGFGAAGTLVALSNGEGSFAEARLVLDNFGAAQGWSSQDAFARVVGDVNGDGRADIVGFGAAGTFVAYGLEDGTFSAASFDVENFGQAQGWTSDTSFHRTLADIDNDGLNDVIGFGFAGVLAGYNQGDVLI